MLYLMLEDFFRNFIRLWLKNFQGTILETKIWRNDDFLSSGDQNDAL